jgi:hypothetical protein
LCLRQANRWRLAAWGVDVRGGTFSQWASYDRFSYSARASQFGTPSCLRFNFNVYTRGNENLSARNYYFTFDFGNLNPKDPQLPRRNERMPSCPSIPICFNSFNQYCQLNEKTTYCHEPSHPIPKRDKHAREAHTPLSIFNRKRLFDLA